MTINTKIPRALLPFFQRELAQHHHALQNKNWQVAWHHLERAHILGQSYPYAHTLVHWKMLKFGFTVKNPKEIIGQLPRLLVGGIKSFINNIPVGNPGGANVPALKPFPIEKQLRDILTANT